VSWENWGRGVDTNTLSFSIAACRWDARNKTTFSLRVTVSTLPFFYSLTVSQTKRRHNKFDASKT
jgi:hypothetical protein